MIGTMQVRLEDQEHRIERLVGDMDVQAENEAHF